MKVESGNVVKVHYTGTLSNGEEFDSSRDKEPIEFQVGSGMVIKGFEDALIGMAEGETKTINIASHDAYGDPQPEMIQEVSLSQLPEGVKEGDMLQAMTPFGPVPVTVAGIEGDMAKVDGNHPLAGKDLTFEIEVVSISTAPAE